MLMRIRSIAGGTMKINLKPIETNQVEDFMKNPNLFEQYDNSYVVTITFYDKLQNDLQ